MARLDDVDDHLHQRDRREKLAAIVRALIGELGEEVFVDATEDVATSLLQFVRVEGAQQLAQHVVGDVAVILLGQLAGESGVVFFDRLHRIDNRLGAIIGIAKTNQVIELGGFVEEDRSLLGKVFLGQRASFSSATGQDFNDLVFDIQIAAVGVAQKNQPHHGHEVFVAGQLRVGAHGVGGLPQAFFDGFDMLELGHLSWIFSLCVATAIFE